MNVETSEKSWQLRATWFCLVLGIAATLHLGDPLFGAHSFRQTQTAQTAQIFLTEGWKPFYPKVHFADKPGFLVLEFPAYQSVVAGIAGGFGLSVEMAGRIVSLLGGLLFCLGIMSLARLFAFRGKKTRDESSLVQFPAVSFLVIFGSPLLFSISQWVSIETFNGACSVWGLFFCARYLLNTSSRSLGDFIAFFLLTLTSLLIKPVYVFAQLPIYAFLAWTVTFGSKEARSWGPLFKVITSSLVAVAIAATWYLHGERVNASTNEYALFGHFDQYVSILSFLSADGLFRLSARLVIYVLGPGTVLLLMLLGLAPSRLPGIKSRLAANKVLVITCLVAVATYLAVFVRLNIKHSYYQTPILVPLYLAILLVFGWNFNKKFSIVLVLCLAMNFATSEIRMLFQDESWKGTSTSLQKIVPAGAELKELPFFSNHGAYAAIAGFYFGRYLQPKDQGAVAQTDPLLKGSWLAICDNQINLSCKQQFTAYAPQCASTALEIGHLWSCYNP